MSDHAPYPGAPLPREWRHGRARAALTAVAALMIVAAALVLSWTLFAIFDAGHVDGLLVMVIGLVGVVALMVPLLAVALIRGALVTARWRLELDGSGLTANIPRTWAGPNPFVPFRSITIALNQIRAVEIRDEVTRFFGLPSITRALSVATTGGERIVLGFRGGVEIGGLPLEEIGNAIARAADLPLTDRGMVDAPSVLAATLKGRSAAWDGPEAPAPLEGAEASNVRWTVAVISLLSLAAWVLVGLGRACTPS